MRRRNLVVGLICLPLLALAACQAYDFVFQPLSDRQGTHLLFAVQQPSKADILFVVDNSGSMTDKQQQLLASFDTLLTALAPEDTEYRIGVVSTDAHGFVADCNGNALPPVASNNMSIDPSMGSKGNCDPNSTAQLRRPHDGTLGRLIAAYDPRQFDPNSFPELAGNALAQNVMLALSPNGPRSGPVGLNGDVGARWVIDRAIITAEACASNACGCGTCIPGIACGTCSAGNDCFDKCANPVAQALVKAYFRSNIAALGNSGFGWEEGLKSSMWAVGVNPEDPNDATALTPSYNLTLGDPNSSNTYTSFDSAGTTLVQGSWLRSDALLAVLFLTDEQDCSMPEALLNQRSLYESPLVPADPVGSLCYQSQAQPAFLDPNRMASLLMQVKGSPSKVAVGFIGGVTQTGAAPLQSLDGAASDCLINPAGSATPSAQCTCWASSESQDPNWCNFTVIPSTPGAAPSIAACRGLAGSRYVQFTNAFTRRTFESVCRNDSQSFGPALADFARIATLACFDMQGVRPANNDPNFIVVKRSAAGSGLDPNTLPNQPATSSTPGWYFDVGNDAICLTGLDRLIGDQYDIFVLETDSLDFTQR